MAGLPNFATYFGRDTLMTALMMEPIWTPTMLEHVMTSVLRKLSPRGEVSHEEALGGQAIRENAAAYSRLVTEFLGNEAESAAIRTKAENLLANLQAVREDYRMLDDDFQLPVLVARYLTRSDVPRERKLAFLVGDVGKGENNKRIDLIWRNLAYVAQCTHAYAQNPVAENLIAFPKADATRWFSGSWRDSSYGYANGRFAMDINVVWVPQALKSLHEILNFLQEKDVSTEKLAGTLSEISGNDLLEYAKNPALLEKAIACWEGSHRHFAVHLTLTEVQEKIKAKLDWLPQEEKAYWGKILGQAKVPEEGVHFLALSLDGAGKPIPVANTDIGMWLFLDDWTEQILQGKITAEEALARLQTLVLPAPIGLFVEGIGPLVSQDTYASAEIWENFRRDPYHSPRVVWGREVNLLILGLRKQILAALDPQDELKDPRLESFVAALRHMLTTIRTAVDASGLRHNELWSYRIQDTRLLPVRYATSCDVQLWNLTDLAVRFLLEGK